MTALIAITTRVQADQTHNERRDALDQRWVTFLDACGLTPLIIPNDEAVALRLLSTVTVKGLILTGGNSLSKYGGDAPERDATEAATLKFMRESALPVLGVCRGMQLLLDSFGARLEAITGHVGISHTLISGRTVNSYHDFAARSDAGALTITECASDGVIEAIQHPSEAIFGIMWHPERNTNFEPQDIALVRHIFFGGFL